MIESAFFQDLAMQMFVAGAAAVIFMRLGWPKAIGYILAGVLMSEYTWGGCFLKDPKSVQTIGQLGIVFLMFGMGLSFSPKEMSKIRFVTLPTAIFDVCIMVCLGYLLGTKCFGWSKVHALFLGVAICDSATTLLAKIFDEKGWGRRLLARYSLGTSVCEDILTVGVIAVATGFAQGNGMSAGALFSSLGWLAVFFLTVLVFGFILLPRLLESVGKQKDDEALLLTILGVCFFVSFVAEELRLSLALGAFLVGIIAASSGACHKLESLVNPLKSMFSAVFFVSIGLLVDIGAIWRNFPQILLVSAVIMIGKMFNITGASLATGLDIKMAVQNGFCLAQVGEFAFMVALIVTNLTSDSSCPIFEIAIGASLLTTLLNPLMIRVSEAAGDFAVRRTPEKFKRGLATYHAWLEKIRSSDDSPAYRLLRTTVIKLAVYAVLMLSVSVGCMLLREFDFSRFSLFFERHDAIIFFFLANVFSVALLPLILSASRVLADEIAELLAGDGSVRWQLAIHRLIRFIIPVVVLVLFALEWLVVVFATIPIDGLFRYILIFVVLGVGLVGWRFFVKAGRRASQRFQEALTAEERREGLMRMTTISVPEGTIHKFLLTESSPAIGETVVTLNIRAKTGASIVSVLRNGQVVRNVGPEWEFQVGDVLVAIGEQTQIAALKDLLGVTG